ncbi:ABC transporter substrate-binding protein [Acidimangrovimonas sediminis]|uniref:ABC transporter substrate-binding protein n=1 Tax=Acidimangrovimonas sediminis TaxID=2056283 RepID=UPI000C810255|nr:extracellular solute-binding protein [Acidimangrovimonas sediminis]
MKTWKITALATVLASAAALPAMADIVMYDKLDFAKDVAAAFTKKTGIKVDVVQPGSTGELLGKIAAEGDNPQFDVVWVDGSAVLTRMLENGVVRPVPEKILKQVPFTKLGESLIPANHAFIPTGASTTAIEVGSKKVAKADWPHGWADLARFKGAVAAKDPNFSGPAYQWLAGLFQTNGVEGGKKLLQEVLTSKSLASFSSGGKINKAILTGDAKIGINQDSSIIAKMRKGEPVQVIYPKEGSVALPEGLAISAKSKHMAEVEKFIAFVFSKEGQAAQSGGDDTDMYYIPVVKGIKAKGDRPTDINFIQLDDKAAAAHETAWKQWYRDTFVR